MHILISLSLCISIAAMGDPGCTSSSILACASLLYSVPCWGLEEESVRELNLDLLITCKQCTASPKEILPCPACLVLVCEFPTSEFLLRIYSLTRGCGLLTLTEVFSAIIYWWFIADNMPFLLMLLLSAKFSKDLVKSHFLPISLSHDLLWRAWSGLVLTSLSCRLSN